MEQAFLTFGLCLIGLGLLLLLGELFVTSGILLVLAIASLAVGVVFLFKYDTMIGIYGLVGLLVGLPTGGYLILRLLPGTPLSRLRGVPDEEEEDVAESIPNQRELLALKGRVGKALTALRPSGMVDFQGRRVDSITEGIMVEPGCWVRCIDVRGNVVVVRPADGPESFQLESTTLN